MRSIYLDNHPLDKVLKNLQRTLESFERQTEMVNVSDALSRVTAHAIIAKRSSPHYYASAMDGYAVTASETYHARETAPVKLKVNEQVFVVDTGDPLPSGTDAVIMIEHVAQQTDDLIEIITPVYPWQNVRAIGEDFAEGEYLLQAHEELTPFSIGTLLAGGVTEVEVFKKPLVCIIPTGDEIVLPSSSPKEGQIPETNGSMLASLVKQWGAEAEVYPPVKDIEEVLADTLREALARADIVIVNAGSSAGRDDYSARIISRFGRLLAHGINIRPGKPTIIGTNGEKLILGIPGYPVSAAISAELFVKAAIFYLRGLPLSSPTKQTVKLARKIVSPLGVHEFARVKLGKVDDDLIAIPLNRGSGVLSSLVKADGILEVLPSQEGFHQGEQVQVNLLRSLERIENTALFMGSHDILIDILGDFIHRKNLTYSLAAAHVGSMGGIMALKRNEAHLAAIHLLDEETGVYNKSFVKRYLNEEDFVLQPLVKRTQGFMVAKGNPLKISSLKDVCGGKIRFVNRQKGSGTRILTDYLLKKEGLETQVIYGYDREETTHLGVAAQVANGGADVGVGIYSAAKIYSLDFIPFAEEDYDLLIPKKFINHPIIDLALKLITEEEFARKLKQIGGYKLTFK